jgi:hypothetical protein
MRTDDRSRKSAAAKAANAARFRGQDIPIDKNWRAVRADQLNWELRYKGKFFGYYGSLAGALRALPDKMLSESAGSFMAEVHGRQKAILESVDKALAGLERSLAPGCRCHNLTGRVLPK